MPPPAGGVVRCTPGRSRTSRATAAAGAGVIRAQPPCILSSHGESLHGISRGCASTTAAPRRPGDRILCTWDYYQSNNVEQGRALMYTISADQGAPLQPRAARPFSGAPI